MKNPINYSMCWEDPQLVLKALQITSKDHVLSIASGGENTFATLLKKPASLTAIDSNLGQIMLLRLKIAAIQALTFEEFLQFIGAFPCKNRILLLASVNKYLSKECVLFWSKYNELINKGIIHVGRFEQYLSLIRKYVLKFTLSKKDIQKYFLMDSINQQKQFYKNIWNTWRWRFLSKIFFSKLILQCLARKKEYFKYNKQDNLANYYTEKVKNILTSTPIQNNYFVHYMLTGKFLIKKSEDHPYLSKENFKKLKKLVSNINCVHVDLYNYLKQLRTRKFSKYNLSDIFEPSSQEEYELILREIVKKSKKNARICYWNNLAPRYTHSYIKNMIALDAESSRLFKQDRIPIYAKFIVESVNYTTNIH